MAGPWENYAPAEPAQPAQGPWTAYQTAAPEAAQAEPLTQRIGRALGYADNIVRQIANGATFGFMDEGAARMRSLTEGVPYEQAVAQERQRDAAFRQENPVAAGVAQFGGAVASPLNRLLPFARGQGATLPAAIGRGAVTGATGGAIASYGEGEDAVPQLGSTLLGGGIGALAGGAVPAAIAGAARAGSGIRNLVTGSGATDAERIMLRELGRDGVTPAELAARARAATTAGRPETIADLAGENVRQVAQVVGRTPGQGMQMAGEMLRLRGGQAQGDRLAQEIRRAVSADDFREEMSSLVQQRSADARPLYQRAWSERVPVQLHRELDPIVTGPRGQEALQRGVGVMEEEGRALYLQSVRAGNPDRSLLFDPASVGLARNENGQWILRAARPSEGYSLRLLDAVKRGFDEVVEANRNPQTGLLTQYGRAIDMQRRDLVGMLRDRFPTYRDALDAWAGPSALMDATRLGRQLLSDGPEAAEATARAISRLTPSEREFFRTGVARGLLDRVGAATDSAEQTRLNRIFMSPQVRERLRAAFDSDAEFSQFAGSLRAEANMAATNRAVAPSGGSPTMPMQDRRADLRAVPAGPWQRAVIDPNAEPGVSIGRDLLRAGVQGGGLAPAFRAMQRIGEARDESAYRQNLAQLAPMLFATNPEARQTAADNILLRATRDEAVRRLLAPVASAAGRSLPGAVVMGTTGP